MLRSSREGAKWKDHFSTRNVVRMIFGSYVSSRETQYVQTTTHATTSSVVELREASNERHTQRRTLRNVLNDCRLIYYSRFTRNWLLSLVVRSDVMSEPKDVCRTQIVGDWTAVNLTNCCCSSWIFSEFVVIFSRFIRKITDGACRREGEEESQINLKPPLSLLARWLVRPSPVIWVLQPSCCGSRQTTNWNIYQWNSTPSHLFPLFQLGLFRHTT